MKQEKKFAQEMFFAALADRTRLRLINLIGDAEICVCFLVEVLETNQPKISRHLAYLRRAGIVQARQDGKWVHYSLAKIKDPPAAGILDETREWLKRDAQMQQDVRKLANVCCAPVSQQPVTIQGAPRPAGHIVKV
jgi:ArsR family transcriptional regulator, arsenate/arsenite/antimonite-responsive transcriptional repressor